MKSKLDPQTTPEQKMDAFQGALRKILSVPKDEYQERERQYQTERAVIITINLKGAVSIDTAISASACNHDLDKTCFAKQPLRQSFETFGRKCAKHLIS